MLACCLYVLCTYVMSCDSNSNTPHYPRYRGMSGLGRERNGWGVSDDESENNDKAMSSSWPRGTQ